MERGGRGRCRQEGHNRKKVQSTFGNNDQTGLAGVTSVYGGIGQSK